MRVQTLQAVWPRLAIALLSLLWASAWGQSPGTPYPTKPIRFVVPYPAGAGNDLLARMMGQKMAERFGQPVIIENRPGAGGNIGRARHLTAIRSRSPTPDRSPSTRPSIRSCHSMCSAISRRSFPW